MQSPNLTAVLETLAGAVLGLLADPHAPITSALPTTATAIASSRRWGALLDGALCMSDSLAGPSAHSYQAVDNTGVTLLRRRYPNRAASSRHGAGLPGPRPAVLRFAGAMVVAHLGQLGTLLER